jgi:hypothetical protein
VDTGSTPKIPHNFQDNLIGVMTDHLFQTIFKEELLSEL